jgi:streptomycin 6-kinase
MILMSSLFVPARLQKTAAEFGDEGARWLEELPARIAELARAWGLTPGRAFDLDGGVAWVAPARLDDGAEVVLKIGIPHPEARHEAAALRAFDGRGAARMLRASEDGYSLLLERCVPGTNLWSLNEAEGNAAGAAVLRRLWREPPTSAPFDRLTEYVDQWCEALPRTAPAAGHDEALVAHVIELGQELAATQPEPVLLHGDFHPGNVLSAEREPWLAIDCKPVVGDPAYDLAQWIGNRVEVAEKLPDPVSALRWQIDQLSDLLDLDRARVAGWTFVKSLGWEWGLVVARLFREVLGA